MSTGKLITGKLSPVINLSQGPKFRTMVPFQMSMYQEATWEKWLMLACPLVHDDIETHFEIQCNLLLCRGIFYVVNYNSQIFLMLVS